MGAALASARSAVSAVALVRASHRARSEARCARNCRSCASTWRVCSSMRWSDGLGRLADEVAAAEAEAEAEEAGAEEWTEREEAGPGLPALLEPRDACMQDTPRRGRTPTVAASSAGCDAVGRNGLPTFVRFKSLVASEWRTKKDLKKTLAPRVLRQRFLSSSPTHPSRRAHRPRPRRRSHSRRLSAHTHTRTYTRSQTRPGAQTEAHPVRPVALSATAVLNERLCDEMQPTSLFGGLSLTTTAATTSAATSTPSPLLPSNSAAPSPAPASSSSTATPAPAAAGAGAVPDLASINTRQLLSLDESSSLLKKMCSTDPANKVRSSRCYPSLHALQAT